jgi:hypothetical protein
LFPEAFLPIRPGMTTTHAHDRGLSTDFPLLRRRRMMGLVGGTTVTTLATITMAGEARAAVPSAETVNVLTRSGIVRGDIRRSFGKASAVAKGVPLSVRLNLAASGSGRPAAGLAVYLWHADRDGRYSLYSPGLKAENYLRGVQAADRAGWVDFTSIFPGAYEGRWPHIHYEIYSSIADATVAGAPLQSGQIALPADVCRKVYTVSGYAGSRAHLTRSTLATDPVFTDGMSLSMPSVTGDLTRGLTATLTVRV